MKGLDVESPGSRDRWGVLGVSLLGLEPACGIEACGRLKEIKKVLRKAKGEWPKEEGDNLATLPGNQLAT